MENILKTFKASYNSFKGSLKSAKEKKPKISEIAQEEENHASLPQKTNTSRFLDKSSRYTPRFFGPTFSKTPSPEETSAVIYNRLLHNGLL